MTLSWNEIEHRAEEFAARWEGEVYEKGESQSFWSEFLTVFGVDRRRFGAFFEYAIKKNSGAQGFIDLFWPGKLLAEQKSGGRNLAEATVQAYDYLPNMPDYDLPQGIVVSDFANFRLIDLNTKQEVVFTLADFPRQVKLFGFLINEQSQRAVEEHPVNRQAAEAMANLHNQLRADNYSGHDLELLLVRLVFCLFADDSGIFERNSFEAYIRDRTSEDGSDLGPRLVKIFETLNTDISYRQSSLDQALAAFPYVNGGLFAEPIRTPDFTSEMRKELLRAMQLDWSKVSPAIFGSMFQGVMDEEQRRNLGAHYTSEANILKLIKPLFLDSLYEEFALVKRSKTKLAAFHEKLASLTFLDPACGCGNFLVITYRELRLLEHKVLQALYRGQTSLFDVADEIKCNVDQMYGIEIEDFPALIAQTALWLTDHQMNVEATKLFQQHYARLPLTKSANIHHANALTTDWAEVIAPQKLDYILGNPPFVGQTWQSPTQKREVAEVLKDIPHTGVLDFVSAWYGKAVEMMKLNPNIQTALVSTNSITQGEQVGILWKYLLSQGVHINFAHRTFKWTNDARGVAGVHCVIVGFGLQSMEDKRIFEYPNVQSEPIELLVKHINPYLVDAPDIIIESRSEPICDVPRMVWGNKPVDGGHLILSDREKSDLIEVEPNAAKYIKKLVGAREFIHNESRWCLWLVNVDPSELRAMPKVMERIALVKQVREASVDPGARQLASRPSQFRDIQNPSSYVVIPSVSSERREYIPIGMLDGSTIATNLVHTIPGATLYHFGILTSQMHMAWVRTVCGRLKSDYRYSKDIVYNNFIWPENVTNEQKTVIEQLAQVVLDTRAKYPNSILADLYDPLIMPLDLLKAHKALDRAVDGLYRKESFTDDAARVAFLFGRIHIHK